MAVAEIKKLFLIAALEHKESILEAIQKKGVVQIEDISYNHDKNNAEGEQNIESSRADIFEWEEVRRPHLPERRNMEKRQDELVSSIRFLHNYIPERSGFELLKKGPLTIDPEEEADILRKLDGGMREQVIEEVKELESSIKKLHAERLTLINRRDRLYPWINLRIPLNYICRTEHTRIRALSVPVDMVESCRRAAEDAIDELWTAKVGETKRSKNIIIVYHNDSEEAVEKIIRDFDVHPAVFPCEPHAPSEMIDKINEEIVNVEREAAELEERIKRMNDYLLGLMVAANDLDNSLERKKAQEFCGETQKTFLLRGWIPESEFNHIEKDLSRIAPEIDISLAEPQEDEEVPIVLKNYTIFRPFEVVVDIYGKPNYQEFDPTPSLGLFFFIGFGYCLTDAGYGIMLALIFGLAAWKLKLSHGVKKFCHLMVYSGFSSIILGALTGSWFGNLLTSKDIPLYQLGIWKIIGKFQKFDPLGQHIIIFLGAALALGYIQLAWGTITKLVHNLSKGKIGDALFDPLPWLIFAAGLVVLVYQRTVGIWMCIIALSVMLLFAGRKNKNIFLRIGSGLWTIYGVLTGLLSDVLSYSRLFALGLATGIMATVINIMAFMMWSIPGVGWLLTILVLVIAHPINLVINVLSAFIHTARLQFVEFFPKFYENGGRGFEPFTMKRRFIHIENKRPEETEKH